MRFIQLRSKLLMLGLFAAAVLFCGYRAAWAQSTSGDVIGTVVDSSGAAIGGATVTATNIATGVATTAQANAVGQFRITNLLAGTYNITGSASGFASFKLKDFDVQLNTTSTANLVLPVATSTTNVEVSAEATAVLDTTTSQLSTTFETEELKNLPTASTGMGVLNLSLLLPGVASSGAIGEGKGPTVSGMRAEANNFTIEGIDNNAKSYTGPLVYVPNDAVGEFTVIVDQFSPEFGHSMGGQFNTTVRSGGNAIHGEAYEYFQNRNMNAENAIVGGKVPNPRYDNNRYGGQVGGPIKRNKLFYFANFERNSIGQSSQHFLCAPTAAGIATLKADSNFSSTNLGIFTKYTPVASAQVDATADDACYNEKTGAQYLTVYDGTTYNTGLNVYGSGASNQIPLGNVLALGPNYSNMNVLTTSMDWTISSRDSFRGRYIYNDFTATDTGADVPTFYTPQPAKYHLIALSEYHDFTPNLINEARLGYNRYDYDSPAGSWTFPGLNAFPNLVENDVGYLQLGPEPGTPQGSIQNVYQFTDNVTWVKGKHSFKFGFDGRKLIAPLYLIQRVRGDYEYNFLTEYLHDLAPTYFGERSTGSYPYYGDQTAFYGYGTDTWRLTKKLSLNLGLRWEYTGVPFAERMQTINSAASDPGLIVFGEPQPQYKNFAPRVGFNYALKSNTSVRGGFSMAYDVVEDTIGNLMRPPQYSTTTDVGGAGAAPAGSANFLANGGLPAGTGGIATYPTVAAQRAATTGWVPLLQQEPYTESWTLGVQHVFHNDFTAEVRYVGNRGIHLDSQVQMNVTPRATTSNQVLTSLTVPSVATLSALTNTLAGVLSSNGGTYILPAYEAAGFTNKITSYQPQSQSSYNGMEASLNRHFNKDYLLNLSYTWSNTMDDGTAEMNDTVLSPRRAQNSQDIKSEYSRSALSHRHRISLVAEYDVPFLRHSSSWYMKNLVGNWAIAPIYIYESPEYYTVLSGIDSNENGDNGNIERTMYNASGVKHTGTPVIAYANPSLAGSCAAGSSTDPNGTLLCNADLVAYVAQNPNAQYITAGLGTVPTTKRNSEAIQPINNFDATAIKRFTFWGSRSLEFQAQAYNLLNHPQHMPGTIDNVNSPGYTTQTLFQQAGNVAFDQAGKFFAANARTLQLALKFTF